MTDRIKSLAEFLAGKTDGAREIVWTTLRLLKLESPSRSEIENEIKKIERKKDAGKHL